MKIEKIYRYGQFLPKVPYVSEKSSLKSAREAFLCKKSKKTPSIANISMRILKIEAVWRIDALPL